jgi:hypothetical protein
MISVAHWFDLCNDNTMNQVVAAIKDHMFSLRKGYTIHRIFQDNVKACRLLRQNGYIAYVGSDGVYFMQEK